MEVNRALSTATGGHGRYEGHKRAGDLTGRLAIELHKNAARQRELQAKRDALILEFAASLEHGDEETIIDLTGENYSANPTY